MYIPESKTTNCQKNKTDNNYNPWPLLYKFAQRKKKLLKKGSWVQCHSISNSSTLYSIMDHIFYKIYYLIYLLETNVGIAPRWMLSKLFVPFFGKFWWRNFAHQMSIQKLKTSYKFSFRKLIFFGPMRNSIKIFIHKVLIILLSVC